MPMACMHSAHSHSLEIVLHAMLNLLVMAMTVPHLRPSSIFVATSIVKPPTMHS